MHPKDPKKNQNNIAEIVGRLPFTKGVSGNPNGRPKNIKYLSEAYRLWLAQKVITSKGSVCLDETNAELIARVVGELALSGNMDAINHLADRTEGKPRQAIEIKSTLDQARRAVNLYAKFRGFTPHVAVLALADLVDHLPGLIEVAAELGIDLRSDQTAVIDLIPENSQQQATGEDATPQEPSLSD